jgi:hypothetical protein
MADFAELDDYHAAAAGSAGGGPLAWSAAGLPASANAPADSLLAAGNAVLAGAGDLFVYPGVYPGCSRFSESA